MRIMDIHCHLLPHVDDGAKNLQESAEMIRMLWEQGVRTIIATPHYRKGMFEPSMEMVQTQLMHVRRVARKVSRDIKIYLGCEFHVNMDMPWILSDGERPTLAGSSYVLSEFADSVQESYMRERIQTLRGFGYTPVIAHIERYQKIIRNEEFVAELSAAGAKIQVDAETILKRNPKIKRFCRWLSMEDLLDFIGSDAHSVQRRAPCMGACREYLVKKCGKAYARKIMEENPEQILRERKF